MKILLHICCAPCTIYPLDSLKEQGHTVTGFFYNPNIHPYREHQARLDATVLFAAEREMDMITDNEYPLEEFLRAVTFRENNRCPVCYAMRLAETARIAATQGFDAFTSTLLYSVYQDHEMIRQLAETEAGNQHIDFFYEDFRAGWNDGVTRSRELGIYRQKYCGCIYSERDRFKKTPRGRR